MESWSSYWAAIQNEEYVKARGQYLKQTVHRCHVEETNIEKELVKSLGDLRKVIAHLEEVRGKKAEECRYLIAMDYEKWKSQTQTE